MELKGKPLTLSMKIIAAVLVIIGLCLKIFIWPDIDIDAVIKVATFIVIIFAPIDLSLLATNIFGGKR